MMHGCQKCCKATSLLVLALGVLFLLVDWGVWDFWGINWWTAIFIVIGITCLAKSGCKECQAIMIKKK